MKTNKFTGPLFIVGSVRSGTKLLRDLLNRNPKIGIPVIESNFIPTMIHKFGNPPKFENDIEYDRFFSTFSQTSFYWLFKKTSYCALAKDYIAQTADLKSWRSIFEAIFKYYAPEGREEGFIWGDKTPDYLKHIELLKELFPDARFLHIIRDPRDVCLSVKKAWGVSLYRTANKWYETLEMARRAGHQIGNDYVEVFYEALLENPKKVLADICKFLNCEFTVKMMKLERPSENLGDARGKTNIVQNNKKKYLAELSASQVKRIEEIVYPVANNLGYKFENDVEHVPLNPVILMLLRGYNVWAYASSFAKEEGLIQGIHLLSKLIYEGSISHKSKQINF